MPEPWSVEGDLLLSCNCEVFCPCVVSLGRARPTEDDCLSWWALRIDGGRSGAVELSGVNAAILLDVPGIMARGGWTIGLYVDDGASAEQATALESILTGRAGGSTGWFEVVIATYLGMRRTPVIVQREGRGWRVEVPRTIEGRVEPIPGASGDEPVRIVNTRYWVAAEVTVCTTDRSRVRDWGRNWDLGGRSAEHARIRWSGP